MKNCASYKSYKRSPFNSIKHNTYFSVYDELFSRFRGKKITFVEVGILDGGSLFMWRDYFGPKARIIGVDLSPEAKHFENYGFEIYIGNQSDESFWKDFKTDVGKIDIVLDDGGHTYDQQIVTTEALLENINDGGLLVVEDTHTSYLYGYGPKRYSFVKYTKKMVDAINHRHGSLDKRVADYRVWSIEIFDSIVAFKINKKFSYISSASTDNGGKMLNVSDQRYSDIVGGSYFASTNLIFLKSTKFGLLLGRILRHFILVLSSRAKRFF